MGCNAGGKGDSNKAKGKGNGKKAAAGASSRGGGGAAAAAGSDKSSSTASAGSKLGKETAANSKKLDQLVKNMAKLMEGSTPKKAGKFWTCLACGDERCFASRQDCHACGADRDLSPELKPQPAARGAAAKATATVEVKVEQTEAAKDVQAIPLEEQIANIEADVKVIKGAKSPLLKAQLAALEAELQVLRERQRKERPLPARLQAATHRLEKAKAAQVEATELVDDLEEELAAAKVGLGEAENKLLEAEQELQEVKQQVADGQATGMAASFQHVLLQNMTPEHAQGLWASCLQHYSQMVAAGGAGVPLMQVPRQQSPQQSSQQPGLQAAGVVAASARAQTEAVAAALGTMASQAQVAQVAAAAAQAQAEAQAAVAAQAAQVAAAATQVHAQAALAAGQQQQQQQQQQSQQLQLQQQQLQGGGAAVDVMVVPRQSDLREHGVSAGKGWPRQAAASGARSLPNGGRCQSAASSDEEASDGHSRSRERHRQERAARAADADMATATEVQSGRQRTLEQLVQPGRA
jgi:hypothetical protein